MSFSNVASAVASLSTSSSTAIYRATKYFKANSEGADAVAAGNEAVAIGPSALAAHDNAVALGHAATALSVNSMALGANSRAIADNAVALGANSVADRANTISVGSAGRERQISHVAAGTADTDAVNVSQLRGYTASALAQANDYANQGVAMALAVAGLPLAAQVGKKMFAISGSVYRGHAAFAMGVSGQTPDGKWVYKSSLSHVGKHFSGTVGVGYVWD
ncbi:MAG: YadA family autotransporter adhesin [Formosimonas sp.]